MGLESATYISDLVATNPDGADGKDKGDDHLRLLKSVLKASFPNVNGAVNATPAELNSTVGGITPSLAALSMGASMSALLASPLSNFAKKFGTGLCLISVAIRSTGAVSNGTVIATIPAGYRPQAGITDFLGTGAIVASGSTFYAGGVRIDTNGNVIYTGPTTAGNTDIYCQIPHFSTFA